MTGQDESLRTVALAGHIDSGCTSLARALQTFARRELAADAARAFRGAADGPRIRSTDGNWDGHPVRVVDSVGPLDFSLTAEPPPELSGVVMVLDAVAGVQRQTYSADRRIRRQRLPRLAFINKCDRSGADPDAVVEQLRSKLALNPVVVQLPIGLDQRFVGVVDLIALRALRFAGETGDRLIELPIPEDLIPAVRVARARMLDQVAMYSDALTGSLQRGEPPVDEIHAALAHGATDRKLTPVLLGSAYKHRGMQPLLDAIVRYLPPPHRAARRAHELELSDSGLPSVATLQATAMPPDGIGARRSADGDADSPFPGPLRILQLTRRGTLGEGRMGVVMARAGEGKSGCLVRLGIDYLLRGGPVLHVALGEIEAQARARYRSQLSDLRALADDAALRTRMDRLASRMEVVAVSGTRPDVRSIDEACEALRGRVGRPPAAILVDGYLWSGPVPRRRLEIDELRAAALRCGAELWMTVQTLRSNTGVHPTSVPPACEDFLDRIDVAVFLEPMGRQLAVRLLYDAEADSGGRVGPSGEHAAHDEDYLLLDGTVSVLDAVAESYDEPALEPRAFTLLSGGAEGAEACFGRCAERWGVSEINYSFRGREVARTRGLIELSEAELALGEVSPAYLAAHAPGGLDAAKLRPLLSTIWHQVVGAGQVFVVGSIQPDRTVRGGTGWAVELAKRWGRPVHVYDEPADAWFSWSDGRWQRVELLSITSRRFCGTGTRRLGDAGRRAIERLFRVSFGLT